MARFLAAIVTGLTGLALALGLTACGGGGSADAFASPASNLPQIQTYPAVMVTASWLGGATGAPTDVKSFVPAAAQNRTLCPPSSLILENHSARYSSFDSNSRNELIIANNCTAPLQFWICATAGSGGTIPAGMPVCAVDPRLTPWPSFSAIAGQGTMTGANGPDHVWNGDSSSPLELSVTIFYCAVGDPFSLGIGGSNPTDCMAQ